jgi:hypothetical protein|tara:strand:- start:263 stop:733 length:471 start_codon:yes stop_codon:yes gene_type:complete
MSQYAFGHALRIKQGENTQYRFQNFFINQQITHQSANYTFVPFGFSGVTVNRTGDGLEATVVFPNNELSRPWGIDAINQNWVMEVDVLIIDDDAKDGPHNIVHSYTGQVVGGQWDEVSLNLQLSTVLDAVGTDVPRRSLTKELVGNLPIANNVRLQ